MSHQRHYLINRAERTALLVGLGQMMPRYTGLLGEAVTKWQAAFPGSTAYGFLPGGDSRPPWSLGNGGQDTEWACYILVDAPSLRGVRPSGDWERWPTDTMSLLSRVIRDRR